MISPQYVCSPIKFHIVTSSLFIMTAWLCYVYMYSVYRLVISLLMKNNNIEIWKHTYAKIFRLVIQNYIKITNYIPTFRLHLYLNAFIFSYNLVFISLIIITYYIISSGKNKEIWNRGWRRLLGIKQPYMTCRYQRVISCLYWKLNIISICAPGLNIRLARFSIKYSLFKMAWKNEIKYFRFDYIFIFRKQTSRKWNIFNNVKWMYTKYIVSLQYKSFIIVLTRLIKTKNDLFVEL